MTTLTAHAAARGFPTPDDATNTFMDDWQHDRKAAMSRIADRARVVGVYQHAVGPATDSRGCEEPSNPAITTAGCVVPGGRRAACCRSVPRGGPSAGSCPRPIYEPLSSDTP